MNRAEYLQMAERLRNGETVEWTPEQAAEYIRAETRERIREGVNAARRKPQPLDADTLERLLVRYGGNFGIWPLFVEVLRTCRVTPAAFSSGLADAYTMGHADRETALACFGMAQPSDVMNADDLAVFRSFRFPLRLYRGCGVDEHERGVYGLSWTTDPAVAEFFAWRFDPNDTDRVVVTTQVERFDVHAYFNTRQEREVIADVSEAANCSVEVVASEPTNLYWERMKKRG